MRAVVDGECGDAVLAGTLGKHRQTEFEGGIGETAPGIHLDDRRGFLRDDFRLGVRLDLASLDRAQRALDPVDAVRLAGIAFAGNDHPGESARLDHVKAALAEDRLDALLKRGGRQGGCLAHVVSLILGLIQGHAVDVLHT